MRRSRRGLLHSLGLLIAIAAAGSAGAHTEDPDDDPLFGKHVLGNDAEIVAFWAEERGDADTAVHHALYDYLGPVAGGNPGGLLEKPTQTISGVDGISGEKAFDLVTGDFNEDGFDDLISIWEGPSQSVTAAVPRIRQSLDWTNHGEFTLLPAGSLMNGAIVDSQIRLVTGQFDGDAAPELVLAYWAADGTVQVHVYDTGGTLVPQRTASLAVDARGFAYEFMEFVGANPLQQSSRMDVATGDFDADGTDEIVLIAVEATGSPSEKSLHATIYDYDPGTQGNPTLVPRARATGIALLTGNSDTFRRAAVGAGDFDADDLDELAVAYQQFDTNQERNYIQLVDVDLLTPENTPLPTARSMWGTPSDTSSLSFNTADRELLSTENGGFGHPVSVLAANLDGFPAEGEIARDEIVVGMKSNLHLLSSNDSLQVTQETQGFYQTNRPQDSHRSIALADLNADPDDADWNRELVTISTRPISGDPDHYRFGIVVHEITFDSNGFHFEQATEIETQIVSSDEPRFGIALGDFDGSGVRLGPPTRAMRTDIRQPLVILNAPPIHFDVLNDPNCPDQKCDVNLCFNQNVCQFSAIYNRASTQTFEVTSEIHSTTATSSEIDFSSFFGINISGAQREEHGEDFSAVSSAGRTFAVSTTVNVFEDDRVFASVVDYDLWEYPVLAGGSAIPRGHLLVVVPRAGGGTQSRWLSSKGLQANAYVPDHEVGNILSYPPDTTNPSQDVALPWADSDQHELDGNVTTDWTLATTDFSASTVSFGSFNSTSDSASVGFDLTNLIPLVGSSLNYTENDYAADSVSTHTTRLSTEDIGVAIHLDRIDRSIGDTRYVVQPFVYWARNGALVVDYAVNPVLGTLGGVPTWWDVHYGSCSSPTVTCAGKPDPAFLLPFRLDPEKGMPLTEDAKRQESPAILFDPISASAGEDVTIYARVHNFSLTDTSGPITVKFYAADPAMGAQPLISSTTGNDFATIATTIPARGATVVSFDWTIPPLTNVNALRMYARIDPDDAIDEIHEDNNTGWNVILPVPVPEPSVAWLRAVGLVALAALVRRRSRTHDA